MIADLGLLVLRAIVGLAFAGHGAQKLFGWFGGSGIDGTTRFVGTLGLRPARAWAYTVALAEFVGGLFIALGILGPVGPALVFSVMLVAIATVHLRQGFWNQNGGIEYPVVNAAIAVALALTGYGAYALDNVLNVVVPEPEAQLVALGVAVIGAVVAIATALVQPSVTPRIKAGA